MERKRDDKHRERPTEQETDSETLKRSMSERDRESEVIEIDTDITSPGTSNQPHSHGHIDQEDLS
jgi:hypothetical protein